MVGKPLPFWSIMVRIVVLKALRAGVSYVVRFTVLCAEEELFPF